jgi:hypothetical protein
MKLPHGDKAIIDQRKVVDYCLSPYHDDGKHKARLFEDLLGLTRDHAVWLLDALREAAVSGEAVLGRIDRHGQRYVIDFDLVGPTGRALVRSAWIVRTGETIPRLVTCYIP